MCLECLASAVLAASLGRLHCFHKCFRLTGSGSAREGLSSPAWTGGIVFWTKQLLQTMHAVMIWVLLLNQPANDAVPTKTCHTRAERLSDGTSAVKLLAQR